jgi:hypothetical protein
MATTFLYRCPITDQTVQGWSADEVTDDETAYESVGCLACRQQAGDQVADQRYAGPKGPSQAGAGIYS